MKPIKLYSHKSGPNPWKVAMIMRELGIEYENDFVPPADLHTPKFEVVNPNGRVPAIHDPNTDVTLWESGAIILYLVDTYDKEGKLKPAKADYYKAQQWLFYQASGQGPYFGQFVWFTVFHHEQLESAKERYAKEIKRVTKVLDSALKDSEWLVSGKCTYVDIAFLPWYNVAERFDDVWKPLHDECPNWSAWINRIKARPAIKEVAEEKVAVSK